MNDALAAAAAAGLAVALWAPDSSRRLRYLLEERQPRPATPVRRWHGRPDGLPRGLRLALGAVIGLLTGLGLSRSGLAWGPAWLTAVLLGCCVFVLLGRLELRAARARRLRLVRDLPGALDLLGGCLAAGLPVRLATEAVVEVLDGPVAEELGAVVRRAQLGASDAEAWQPLRQHAQLGGLAADVARAAESGTMLVPALIEHAREARARRRAALEVAARAVGVRSVVPMMLCFIPAFLLLGIVPTVVSAFRNALPL